MANQAALQRAITEGIKVNQLNSRCWTATSSRGGEGYKLVVDQSNGQVFCNCPAGLREITCKHAALVASILAERATRPQRSEVAGATQPKPRPEPAFCCSKCGMVGCEPKNHAVPMLSRLMA